MHTHNHVLCFVRGVGHRSAIIAQFVEATLSSQGLTVSFASYGAGAETLSALGRHPKLFVDNDAARFSNVLVGAARLIAKERPVAVISYGEPAAVVAAASLEVPTVFLTSDGLPPGPQEWDAVNHARAVLVLDQPGVHPVPGLKTRLHFVGRAVRPMNNSARDRLTLRRAYSIDPSTTVLCVVPGASSTEEMAPWADTIITAFHQIAATQKVLLWFTSRDRGYLKERTRCFPNIFIREFSPDIGQVMAISDVVVAKNAGTVFDALSVGTRTISLYAGQNGCEASLSRIQSHLSLTLAATNGELLHRYIASILHQPPPDPIKPTVARIVEVVARELREIIAARNCEAPREAAAI